MQPSWKTGLIECGGHCEAHCGSSDVSGGKPRPRTRHLGQKRQRGGPDFLPRLHASPSLGALPLPRASPQRLPRAPVLAPRAGPAVLALCFPVQAGSWPCQCIYPRRQPRSSCTSTGRGSVFLSVLPWAAIPPESCDSIASEIGSHERTCLVVKAVPGGPVSIPECRRLLYTSIQQIFSRYLMVLFIFRAFCVLLY